MGAERSLAKVAEKLGKSKTLMHRWSSEHAWVLRATAWDTEQDRELQAELTAARRDAARRNVDIGKALKQVAGHSLAKLATDKDAVRPSDLVRFLEVATRLEQAAFATVGPAGGAAGDGGVDDVDLDSLTDEEIRFHMASLRRELDAELADYPDIEDGSDPADVYPDIESDQD